LGEGSTQGLGLYPATEADSAAELSAESGLLACERGLSDRKPGVLGCHLGHKLLERLVARDTGGVAIRSAMEQRYGHFAREQPAQTHQSSQGDPHAGHAYDAT